MFISVIIPAFNEEALIGTTIDRIRLAFAMVGFPSESWELIVCDNSSTDRTAEIAATRVPGSFSNPFGGFPWHEIVGRIFPLGIG